MLQSSVDIDTFTKASTICKVTAISSVLTRVMFTVAHLYQLVAFQTTKASESGFCNIGMFSGHVQTTLYKTMMPLGEGIWDHDAKECIDVAPWWNQL